MQTKINRKITTHKYYMNQKHKIRLVVHGLKINGCSICGYNKCVNALEFHHVNPKDKQFRLNYIGVACHTDIKIKNEFNKCILLCANCHQEIETKNIRMS